MDRRPQHQGCPAPRRRAGLAEMLDSALASCRERGFETRSYDGYIGEAWMGEGSDEDALVILAHLDVVPVGDGWTRDPFGGEIEGRLMYGRGTSDDKGPLAAALYAMHAVKEAGVPLKRKVKLIMGCDEESGMEDIAYYQKVATMPRSGFSPDASYPVINIEKGGCHYRLTGPLSEEGLQILSFNVGERFNVIPGSASALVAGDEHLIPSRGGQPCPWLAGFRQSGGNAVRITATGINGHAAYPLSPATPSARCSSRCGPGRQGRCQKNWPIKSASQYLGEGLHSGKGRAQRRASPAAWASSALKTARHRSPWISAPRCWSTARG